MTRTVFPFAASDVSALARALNRELEAAGGKLGHVQLLNLLARAGGYQNFQHFRAQFSARDRMDAAPPPAEPIDHLRIERVARRFDAAGALAIWPSKASHQMLCLWVLWARIPGARSFSEKQINAVLTAHHNFGDYALLRRLMCDHQMMSRTADGSAYRRIEQRPPAEALALIRHLDGRRAA